MEIKCREPIATAINNHRVLSDKLYEETTDLVTNPVYASRLLKVYAPEKAAETLQKEINDLVSKQKATDKLLNARVRDAIESARLAAIPEQVRNFKKPADYQQQISNALAFLSLEGDGLTDRTAYNILKPFFDDWDQMQLFERAVEKQMHMDTVHVRAAFPNALGTVTVTADTYLALFGEADALAECLLLGDKRSDAHCFIGECVVHGGFGAESYEERKNQDRLIELAERIDTLASDTPFKYSVFNNDFDYKMACNPPQPVSHENDDNFI